MNKTELLPCPFCGGEAKTSWGTVDPDNKFFMGWIGCQNCRCFINYMNNNRGLKEATEAWNKRAENEELLFTRQFIVDKGLHYELLNAWNRRADNEQRAD